MNEKGSCVVSPTSTQRGAIEMSPTQLNKITNIAEELSCQGVNISVGISKKNLSSESAINSPIY